MLERGFELRLRLCALGGCSEPEDPDLGLFLFVGGLVVVVFGSVVAPTLVSASGRRIRATLAVPAALATGATGLAFGVAAADDWLENIVVHLMICAAVAVLVPPRGVEWFAGLVVGGVVAASFADAPWRGITLGVGALVVSVASGAQRGAPDP